MADYTQLARQYGFSESAVQHMAQAVRHGGGRMAQFNHPEFGGSGQWMPGMIMIGDMMNTGLKTRVQALVEALLEMSPQTPTTMPPMQMETWWDASLGRPDTAGRQNDIAYAYFREQDQLLVKRGKHIVGYATNGQIILGVQQQQSNQRATLVFQTTTGSVSEDDLTALFEKSI